MIKCALNFIFISRTVKRMTKILDQFYWYAIGQGSKHPRAYMIRLNRMLSRTERKLDAHISEQLARGMEEHQDRRQIVKRIEAIPVPKREERQLSLF